MECDYKLVENEGLFQEYLEMGECPFLQNKALVSMKNKEALVFGITNKEFDLDNRKNNRE